MGWARECSYVESRASAADSSVIIEQYSKSAEPGEGEQEVDWPGVEAGGEGDEPEESELIESRISDIGIGPANTMVR